MMATRKMMSRKQPSLPGFPDVPDRIEVRIPTMPWEQIGGDMDPGTYGGTIATADGRRTVMTKSSVLSPQERAYLASVAQDAAEFGFTVGDYERYKEPGFKKAARVAILRNGQRVGTVVRLIWPSGNQEERTVVYPAGVGPGPHSVIGLDLRWLSEHVAPHRAEERRHFQHMRAAAPKREAEAGFAIGVHNQHVTEENARERADRQYGDPEWHKEMVHLGVMTKAGEITDKGWALLNRDIDRIERNSLAWMRATFNHARDDGHGGYGGDELVGSFWFDPTDPNQAYLVELASPSPGRSERIDMSDASFGDLANTAFNEVSAFGGSVLGGQIVFFDVKPEDWETIEQTLENERKPTRRSRR